MSDFGIVTKIERYEENDWLNDAIAAVMECTKSKVETDVPSVEAVTTTIKLLTGLGIDFVPVPVVISDQANGITLRWTVDKRELEVDILAGSIWGLEWTKTTYKDNGQFAMDGFDEGEIDSNNLEEVRPLVEWVMGK